MSAVDENVPDSLGQAAWLGASPVVHDRVRIERHESDGCAVDGDVAAEPRVAAAISYATAADDDIVGLVRR
jgi:hypothetical protein